MPGWKELKGTQDPFPQLFSKGFLLLVSKRYPAGKDPGCEAKLR